MGTIGQGKLNSNKSYAINVHHGYQVSAESLGRRLAPAARIGL